MTSEMTPAASHGRMLLVITILFISYLCIAMSLPIIPVYVTGRLGFGNAWAGLGVGIAFLGTIASRSLAGSLSDRRGAKMSVATGLSLYIVGALVSLLAGVLEQAPGAAYATLLAGRMLVGFGESFVAVGVISWGIGLVGPARSGKVLALVGAAIYGALAVGGPIGLVLLDRIGFAGTMAVSVLLPCLGLLAISPLAGIAPHPAAERPSFFSVVGRIWVHGAIVCLHGVGFAAISAFFVLYFRKEGWEYAGLGLTAFGGGFVLVRLLFGHLSDRFGGLPVAIGSLAIETLGQALIWAGPTPTLALVGAFLSGLGCSLVFPAMGREVVRLVEPHLRGTALGAYAAFQDIAYGLTGPLVGLLADRAGYGSVFLIGCIAAGAGFVVALGLRRRQAAA